MEAEKKRKREDNGGERRRKDAEVATVEEEVEAEAEPQPSEEEVEEFFSILRRMHVAVKYFEKNGEVKVTGVNDDGNGCKLMALVKSEVDGVKDGEKRDVAVEDGGLDLNAVPETES